MAILHVYVEERDLITLEDEARDRGRGEKAEELAENAIAEACIKARNEKNG